MQPSRGFREQRKNGGMQRRQIWHSLWGILYIHSLKRLCEYGLRLGQQVKKTGT